MLDPARFEEKARQSVDGVSVIGRRLIESAQPFRTVPADPAQAPIWVLHELARVDRHQVLHTTAVGLAEATVNAVPVADVGRVVHQTVLARTGEPLGPGDEIMRVRVEPAGPDPQMHLNGRTGADIVVRHPDLRLPQASVGDLAVGMCEAVKAVLNGAYYVVRG